MKRLAVFSVEKGFFLGGNEKPTWDFNPDNAILFRVEDHYREGHNASIISDDELSTFTNPDSIRRLDRDDALAELVNIIRNVNGEDLANSLSTLTGDTWEYEGGSSWRCNGRSMDGDNIEEVLHSIPFDHLSLTEVLNEFGERFYWAEDPEDGSTIYTSAAPDLANFKRQAESLLDELDTLANFHLKNDGLKSEDCQLVGIRNAIFEAQKLVYGTTAEDIDTDA